MPRVKYLHIKDAEKLGVPGNFPNFHSSGNIYGMKKLYYGTDALLVRSGKFIYNVSSAPEIYYTHAR